MIPTVLCCNNRKDHTGKYYSLFLSMKLYKMPRNYVRKTIKSYTDETLAKCIDAVKTGKMSLHKASKHFQVCLSYIFLVL